MGYMWLWLGSFMRWQRRFFVASEAPGLLLIYKRASLKGKVRCGNSSSRARAAEAGCSVAGLYGSLGQMGAQGSGKSRWGRRGLERADGQQGSGKSGAGVLRQGRAGVRAGVALRARGCLKHGSGRCGLPMHGSLTGPRD